MIIFASQLGKLFGIKIENEDFFAQIVELITKLDQTNLLTLVFGLVTILALGLLKCFAPKVPGTLVIVVAAIIISSIFHFPILE